MVLKTKKRSFKQYGSGFVKDTKNFFSGLLKTKSRRKSVRRSSSTTATNKPVNCNSHGISPTNCYDGKKKSQTTSTSRKKEFHRQSRLFHPDKNSGCLAEATKKVQLLTATYCVKEEDYHELTSSMKKKRDSEARKQREAEVAEETRKAEEAAARTDLEFNLNNEVGANNDYNEAKINDNTKKIYVLEKAVEKLVKQIKTILTKNKTLKNNPKFKEKTSVAKKLQKTYKDNIDIAHNLRLHADQLENKIKSLLDEIKTIKSIQNLSDADLEDEIQGLVESSESASSKPKSPSAKPKSPSAKPKSPSAKPKSPSAKPKYAILNISQKQKLALRLKINELKPGLYKGRHVYIAGAGVSGMRLDEEDCYVKILEASKGKLVFQQFNSILKRWEDKNKLFERDNLGLKIGTLKSLSKQESKQFENDDDDSEGKESVLNSLRNNLNINNFWKKNLRNLPSEQKKSKAVKKSASQSPKPPPIPSESAPNSSNNLFNITKASKLTREDVFRNKKLNKLIKKKAWNAHLESLKTNLEPQQSDSATPTPKSSISASLTPTPNSPTSKSLKSKKKTQSVSQKARKSNTQSKKTTKSKADKLAKREIANKRANNVAANKLDSNTNIKTTALIETKNLIKSFGISRNPSSNTDTALKNYITSEFDKNDKFQEIESSSMSQSDLNKVKKALNTLFLNLEEDQYSDVQKQVDKINGLVKSSQITIIKPSKSSSDERLRRRQSENNRVRDIERLAREANSLKNLLAKPKGKVKSVSARNSAANQRLNSEIEKLKIPMDLEARARNRPKPTISTPKRSKKTKKSASPKPTPKIPTMKLKDSWITQNQGSHQNNKSKMGKEPPRRGFRRNDYWINKGVSTPNRSTKQIPPGLIPGIGERKTALTSTKLTNKAVMTGQIGQLNRNLSFLEEKPLSAKELNSVLSKYIEDGGIRGARAQFTNNNDSSSSNSNSELLTGSKQKRKSSYKKKKTKRVNKRKNK